MLLTEQRGFTTLNISSLAMGNVINDGQSKPAQLWQVRHSPHIRYCATSIFPKPGSPFSIVSTTGDGQRHTASSKIKINKKSLILDQGQVLPSQPAPEVHLLYYSRSRWERFETGKTAASQRNKDKIAPVEDDLEKKEGPLDCNCLLEPWIKDSLL